MASVPELAICYHHNGVVQGYELLKTDDIFLLKGISEDGTPAFHPYVVQQNGLSVLRFLQDNCKQDPGAYWVLFFILKTFDAFRFVMLIFFNKLVALSNATKHGFEFFSFIKVLVKMIYNFLIFLLFRKTTHPTVVMMLQVPCRR